MVVVVVLILVIAALAVVIAMQRSSDLRKVQQSVNDFLWKIGGPDLA